MVFSSTVFPFYFLPLFLACYLLFPGRKLMLVISSLAFYAIGERQYTLLPAVSGIAAGTYKPITYFRA